MEKLVLERVSSPPTTAQLAEVLAWYHEGERTYARDHGIGRITLDLSAIHMGNSGAEHLVLGATTPLMTREEAARAAEYLRGQTPALSHGQSVGSDIPPREPDWRERQFNNN